VPDFVGEDGVEYTDIEVIVEMDGEIRDAANLADSLQRPVENSERKWRRPRGNLLAANREESERAKNLNQKHASIQEEAWRILPGDLDLRFFHTGFDL
jgi:hypothetical protein